MDTQHGQLADREGICAETGKRMEWIRIDDCTFKQDDKKKKKKQKKKTLCIIFLTHQGLTRHGPG